MTRSLALSLVVLGLLAAAAPAQVTLGMKFPEGTKTTTEVENKTQQILTIGGMDIETKNTQYIKATATAGKRAADGTLEVAGKIESMQADMSFPGGLNLSFSSSDPDKKSDNEQLEGILELFRTLVKSKTTTILDKDNKITSIKREAKDEKLGDMFKSLFDPEYLKKAAAQERQVLPEKAVKEGDTWKATSLTNLGGGQTLEFVTEYKYVGTVEKNGKKLDKIEFKATEVTYAMDPNTVTPLKVTKSDLKIADSGGSLLFDRAKGQIVEKTSKNQIKGDMTLNINNMDLAGKLDLTLESKSTLIPD